MTKSKPAAKKVTAKKSVTVHEPAPHETPEPVGYRYWIEEIGANLGPEATMERLNHLGDLGWRLLFVGEYRAAGDARMTWFIGDDNAIEPNDDEPEPEPIEQDTEPTRMP